jgi:hypothetical protein
MRWVQDPSNRPKPRITKRYLIMRRAIPTKIKILMLSTAKQGIYRPAYAEASAGEARLDTLSRVSFY